MNCNNNYSCNYKEKWGRQWRVYYHVYCYLAKDKIEFTYAKIKRILLEKYGHSKQISK
ncbi:MAG: hypothetical protein PWQ37_2297 [Candidatus Petromonas sp.]|jgi:hypothetical protein|nr:hypothetical protein [Candidatus Petromonas sp.]